MPTPSAPDPQTQYSFPTCPDTDESSRQHNSNTGLVTHTIYPPATVPEDSISPRSTALSPGSQFDSSDGPVSDTDVDTSHPVRGDRAYIESHKITEIEVNRTDSPCNSSPTDSIAAATPRHGVGTNYHMDLDAPENSQYQQQVEYEAEEDFALPCMGYAYPSRRIIPTSPSSFLRAGSRFTGTQQSERQVYDVQVEIKYVDLRESFLCGYLRIQGLTDDHPTLTTYFEGEIIGSKYGFMTKHESWGANNKTDLSHWSKFPAFRPYSKQARRGSSVAIKDVAQSEYIFMRWKEHFLVPDHRVRTITGASFEGFYYICFNQIKGEVNGIYFHSKSERFQQLELKHVADKGCFSALEFR